jgi:dipeptidyl aminopeptidase/acylaminoacyl peptidase
MKRWPWIATATTVAVIAGGAVAVGDYVYRSGTAVPCGINEDDAIHTPAEFYTPGPGNGPFPGENWDKWSGYDLSDYWMTDVEYETVNIQTAENITLEAWWITPTYPESKQTVIVTHGIGTSRRDFNTLLPTSFLVNAGFNVLLVDSRDTGGSTCDDGRHSAGQEESSDFAEVAKWLVETKDIPSESLGMFGVSGGAIATSLMPAKTDLVSAFAMEGTVFDFQAAAIKEVEFQGFPGFLWNIAEFAARLRGVNLTETSVPEAIEAAGDRPMLILHGDSDVRLAYEESVNFKAYADSVGTDVELITFSNADHTEGMLSEPERYRDELVGFFENSLN